MVIRPRVRAGELAEFLPWQRMAGRRVPLSFELELTARCNNNCTHCCINLPASDAGARERELSPGEIERIADEAVELGALWVVLTGGEPLLRGDFSEIYLLLKRKGLLVSVFTNAIPLEAEHIELFRRYPPRDIEVTVYGVTRPTYERVTRRKGSWEGFCRGMALFEESGIPVRLKAMVLRANLHELQEISAFCRAHTRDFFRVDPLLHYRYDGHRERNREIGEQRLTPAEIVAVDRGDAERIAAMGDIHCGRNGAITCRHDCDHLFRCGAGTSSFSVGFDGTFRLCSSLRAPGTGYDLRSGTLNEAWAKVVPRVRGMRAAGPGFVSSCGNCPIVNLCHWCPATAHLECGEMDRRVDYFCRVAQARAAALEVFERRDPPV